MSHLWSYLKADLRRFYHYRIFPIVTVIAFAMAVAVGFFPGLNSANALYLSVFILPVIVFSFSLNLEIQAGKDRNTLAPAPKPFTLLGAKVLAATIVQLLPLAFIMLAMILVREVRINYLLLTIAYILGVGGHIIIGLSLSIINRSYRLLPLSYIVYILVFCALPIFFSNGLVPIRLQYYLIFSPAYLAGILLDNIIAGTMYSPLWLIILSVILQIGYPILLACFVVQPFFKRYLGGLITDDSREVANGERP